MVQADELELRLPARAENIARIRREVAEFALARDVADESSLSLAVSEALTNVVLHAYIDAPQPGSMSLRASCSPRAIDITVTDEGRGLLPRPDSPGLGLGLKIVESLSDEFEAGSAPGGGAFIKMSFGRTPDGERAGGGRRCAGPAAAR